MVVTLKLPDTNIASHTVIPLDYEEALATIDRMDQVQQQVIGACHIFSGLDQDLGLVHVILSVLSESVMIVG